MSRFDAAETLRLIEKHQASWLYLVPTMMLRIWRLPEDVRLAAEVSSGPRQQVHGDFPPI